MSNELFNILGEKQNCEKIHMFLLKLDENYKKFEEVKKYSDACYYSYKNLGISLQFSSGTENEVLSNIHLFRKGEYKYNATYKGDLPYNLSFEMKNSEIVRKFKEPDKKGGGVGRIPIFIEYSKLGFMVEFKDKDWNCIDNTVTTIVIFKPVK